VTTTQIIMIAGALLTFWFSNKPAEGGIWGLIKSIFGGGKLDTANIFEMLAKLLVQCQQCTPDERKKIQDAVATIMKHVAEHTLQPKDANLSSILSELEAIKASLPKS